MTITSTNIDISTIVSRNTDAYVVKDSVGSISGDYEAQVDQTRSGTLDGFSGTCASFGVSSTAADTFDDWGDGHIVGLNQQAATQVHIESFGAANIDTSVQNDANPRYLTITRVSGTVSAKIYTDSDRTTLSDTITLTVSDTETFEYVYAFSSRDIGTTSRNMTFDIDNLNLISGFSGAVASKHHQTIIY